MRRERVAQRVRADAETGAARGHMPPHQPVDAPHRQPPATIVHEQRIASLTVRLKADPTTVVVSGFRAFAVGSGFRLRMKLRRTAVALAEAVSPTLDK